eukprot:scaffold178138_cov20-Prasinocladus_malaysianus.AAC.1
MASVYSGYPLAYQQQLASLCSVYLLWAKTVLFCDLRAKLLSSQADVVVTDHLHCRVVMAPISIQGADGL